MSDFDFRKMVGFRTNNKVPEKPWRQGMRTKVENLIANGGQCGIVPAEQDLGDYTLVVLDLDKKDGWDGRSDLKKYFRDIPQSFNVTTPHGWHLYYKVKK